MSTPTAIDHGATYVGIGVSILMMSAKIAPSTMPAAAPSVLSVEASIRNWNRMSRRRAPSAFRIPISCVRSATATSMMFMITIEPTTSPIAGNATPASTRYCLIVFQNSSAVSDVSSVKLSFCQPCSWRRARITARTRSSASPSNSTAGTCTITPSMTCGALLSSRCTGDRNGAMM